MIAHFCECFNDQGEADLLEDLSLEQLRSVLEKRHRMCTLGGRLLDGSSLSFENSKPTLTHPGQSLDNLSASFQRPNTVLPGDPLAGIASDIIVDEIRTRQKAIYGDDDRIEIIACTNPEQHRRARAVAAIVERANLMAAGNDRVSIGATSLGDRYAAVGKPLCKREPFRAQPSPALGTAFLVGPDIIATAHHCLNEHNFDRYCLLFDFEVDTEGVAPTNFATSQLYGVGRYITGVYTKDGADWALLGLERVVHDREPLALRTKAAADNTPLYVIGHPAGLPKKIAGKAEIRINTAASHFVANLDTYGGNSGSPVFNALTHEVEGILVRGETDFVPQGDCYTSLICPITGCHGEECSRIGPVAQALTALGIPSQGGNS